MSVLSLQPLSAIDTSLPVVEHQPFQARQTGKCSRCRRRISPGDLIIRTGRGYAHLIHARRS